MKKVFNASILAAALGMAFAANAATVTSTPAKLSAEGVAAGQTADNQTIDFDITVTKQHAAASVITLTFDDNVTLDEATSVVTFDVGNGNFSFANTVIDDEENTITFELSLGNAMTADSAFNVSITNVDLAGKASVSYASETAAGVAIETGSGEIADTESQFAFELTTEFSKLIDRTTRTAFTVAPTTDDTAEYTFSNDETMLAALTGVSLSVELEGNFEDLLTADFTGTLGTATVNGASDTVTVASTALQVVDNGDTDVVLDFSRVTAVDIPQTGEIKAKVTVDSADLTDPLVIASDVDAGEWRLDAAIVNVPYLPLGYGLTAQVELSNHGSTDAEIMVEGFDQNGKTYSSVALPFEAEAKTVTRVTEAQLKTAFGIAAADKVKLNVTFVIDADADKVSLVPFYRENESRINVLNDQYKK